MPPGAEERAGAVVDREAAAPVAGPRVERGATGPGAPAEVRVVAGCVEVERGLAECVVVAAGREDVERGRAEADPDRALVGCGAGAFAAGEDAECFPVPSGAPVAV